MDLALLVIAAKVFLGREGTPPPEVPRCGPTEKLTYIASEDRYVCLPEGFN